MPVGRVSDSLRYLGLVPQYNALLSRQIDVQTQIASGKKYQRSDENPLDVGLGQLFSADISRLEQNLRNIDEVQAFTTMTDSTINNALQYMQRAKELAVMGGDGSKSDADRANIANEVDQLLRGVIEMGATKYHGRFIFSGTETKTPAFAAVTSGTGQIIGVAYAGDGGTLDTEFTPGTTITYNLLGSDEAGGTSGVFRDSTAGVDLFQSLIDLRDNLTANPAALGANLAQITNDISHLTSAAAANGGIQNRLSFTADLHRDQTIALSEAASKLVDTDLAAAISELQVLRTAYEASLNVGARVNSISLLDFLR